MRFIAAIDAILLCILVSIPGQAITISLEKVVYYTGSEISLEDIVSIADAGNEVSEKILKSSIPVSEPALYIIPQRIVRDIVKQFTNDPVVITGSRIFAIPENAPSLNKKIYSSLLELIDSESSVKESRIEIEVEEPISHAWSAADKTPALRFRIKKMKLGCIAGTMQIEYTVPSSGLAERFEITVHSYIPVLKSMGTIARDEILSWDKLSLAEEDVSSLSSDGILSDSRLDRYRARTKIEPDSFVSQKMVERIFDVKAHDYITLVFHRGSIWLTMSGTASESGSIGDFVTIKPAEANRYFTGKVTGAREVTIDVASN